MKKIFRGITGNVFVLGLVSFFTDVSSEMIYPLLPAFLTVTLGAGPAFLGLIEGVAESTSSLLKLVSGLWADRMKDRTGLLLGGYGLSSLARPLVAAATGPLCVLTVRFFDRVGKGIRTSPRDAIIADSVEAKDRGKAYGLQRAMDHAGALTGPLVATALLATCIGSLRTLFWLAAVPGLIAVFLVAFFVREPHAAREPDPGRRFSIELPEAGLRKYLTVLFLFTLGNSSDAFLLLRAGQCGVPLVQIPLLWAAFHLVKSLLSMPFGALADRIGKRGMIAAGWAVYALSYVGFAFAQTPAHIWAIFCFYGLFYAMTEGTERALLADLSSASGRGGAFGWFHAIVGLGALPASLLFGFLWQQFSPQAAFAFGATLAGLSSLLLLTLVSPRPAQPMGQGRKKTPLIEERRLEEDSD